MSDKKMINFEWLVTKLATLPKHLKVTGTFAGVSDCAGNNSARAQKSAILASSRYRFHRSTAERHARVTLHST